MPDQANPVPRMGPRLPSVSEAIARVNASESTADRERVIQCIAQNAMDSLLRFYARRGYGPVDMAARSTIEGALRKVPDGDLIASSDNFITDQALQQEDEALVKASRVLNGGG